MRFAIVALVSSIPIVVACGRGSEAAAPPVPSDAPAEARAHDLELDVEAVRRILDEDRTPGPLANVEKALDDDRPVRAAELVEETALPAARDVAARMHAIGTRTPEGHALAERAANALDARTSALAAYGRVLARGPVEDLALLDAMRAYRASEAGLVAARDALDSAGLAEGAPRSTGAAP